MRVFDYSACTPKQLEQLRDAARNAGGALTIEKGERQTAEPLTSTHKLGERIKQQLDPDRIFPSYGIT
jgi:FAD/FMN-containing dehydrogenase